MARGEVGAQPLLRELDVPEWQGSTLDTSHKRPRPVVVVEVEVPVWRKGAEWRHDHEGTAGPGTGLCGQPDVRGRRATKSARERTYDR